MHCFLPFTVRAISHKFSDTPGIAAGQPLQESEGRYAAYSQQRGPGRLIPDLHKCGILPAVDGAQRLASAAAPAGGGVGRGAQRKPHQVGQRRAVWQRSGCSSAGAAAARCPHAPAAAAGRIRAGGLWVLPCGLRCIACHANCSPPRWKERAPLFGDPLPIQQVWEAADEVRPLFANIDRMVHANLKRVQQAMRRQRIGPHHFAGSTGVGAAAGPAA